MSDPRFTDPRLSDPVDPRFDPVLRRRDESIGGMWGWVTGLAVLALIAFVVIAGWDSTGNQTASNNPAPPATTSSAPMRDAPSTTGSGATSPRPATPAPATPAPANNGAR